MQLAGLLNEVDVVAAPTPHLKIMALDSVHNKILFDLKTKLELF